MQLTKLPDQVLLESKLYQTDGQRYEHEANLMILLAFVLQCSLSSSEMKWKGGQF